MSTVYWLKAKTPQFTILHTNFLIHFVWFFLDVGEEVRKHYQHGFCCIKHKR